MLNIKSITCINEKKKNVDVAIDINNNNNSIIFKEESNIFGIDKCIIIMIFVFRMKYKVLYIFW